VVVVGTDILEECITSMFRVKTIKELKTEHVTVARYFQPDFSSLIVFTLKMEAIHSSKTSVPTTTTQQHIPEGDILHSHCCENLKSYMSIEMFVGCIIYI
jgi:hypothetical protein